MPSSSALSYEQEASASKAWISASTVSHPTTVEGTYKQIVARNFLPNQESALRYKMKTSWSILHTTSCEENGKSGQSKYSTHTSIGGKAITLTSVVGQSVTKITSTIGEENSVGKLVEASSPTSGVSSIQPQSSEVGNASVSIWSKGTEQTSVKGQMKKVQSKKL